MLVLISLLEVLLPILYFGTIWMYARAFFSSIRFAEQLRAPLLGSTVILHALYILLRTLEFHHPPITSIFEILSLIAFTVLVVYTYIEVRTRNKATGYFILILPFFFQAAEPLLQHAEAVILLRQLAAHLDVFLLQFFLLGVR